MYKPGDTIQETLDEIHQHKLVLPAIQREFVWRPGQICRLFDSLMQGYPFGTFLYWQVEPENSGRFKFYDFVREYHQRDNPHCPPLPQMPGRQLTAVLDGQQRLTALNIGLRGSMAWKLPRRWWNSPGAFPVRHLYLNEWLRQSQPDATSRQAYLDRHQLGDIPDSITEFDAFYEARTFEGKDQAVVGEVTACCAGGVRGNSPKCRSRRTRLRKTLASD